MTDVQLTNLAKLSERNMRLFIGPRPGKKTLQGLARLDLTHCCTLLGQREEPKAIEKICQKIGCDWIWLPIDGGKPDILRRINLLQYVHTLLQAVDGAEEPRVYFHCSAGIHRTGFFVYVLLRLMGRGREEAFSELSEMRAVTADQVGEERIELAEAMIAEMLSQ